MRSILLVLALAAPCSAFAAKPAADYTSPITTVHSTRPQQVLLTFQNNAVQDRILAIDGKNYLVHQGHALTIAASVGTSVRVYSNQDSSLNGKQLLQVSATDARRIIAIS